MKNYATPETYRAATVAEKARMRADATTALNLAVDNLDMDAARAARDAIKSWTDAVATAPVVIDYGTILGVRAATLRAAADAIESGSVVPDGIPAGTVLTVGPFAPDMDAVRRIAGAKVTRSTVRNDIPAAIERAFEDVDSGTFLSSSMIANKCDLPSSGAVSARHETWNETHADDTGIDAVPASGDRALGYVKR